MAPIKSGEAAPPLRVAALVAAALCAVALFVLALAGGAGLLLRGASFEAPAVVIDAAFAASRPSLAAGLADLASRPFGKARYTVPELGAGPGAFLQAAAASGFSPAGQPPTKGAGRAKGIIGSPLYAQALADAARRSGENSAPAGTAASGTEAAVPGLQALGGAVLVVPEWPGPLPPGMATAATDARPAFRKAGIAAGAWLSAPSPDEGGAAGRTAAILFRERPSRGQDCLLAFEEGFAAAGLGMPIVEILDESSGDADMEAATSRLLAADIGLVLVAIGPGSMDAAARLGRPGIAVGIETTEPAEAKTFAFGIVPDDRGLLKALWKLASGRGGLERMDIPALLVRGKAAPGFGKGRGSLQEALDRAGATRP